MHDNDLGKEGEKQAINFLIKKGYKILSKNYRFQKFEIDIIATCNNILVGIEVKTRSTNHFGNPEGFVKPEQIKRIVKAMDYYINDNKLENEVRFDIISITKNKSAYTIKHIEDAFYCF